MITAVIVLFVIALALGGYLAFDFLHNKKEIAAVNDESATKEDPADEEATPVAPSELEPEERR